VEEGRFEGEKCGGRGVRRMSERKMRCLVYSDRGLRFMYK